MDRLDNTQNLRAAYDALSANPRADGRGVLYTLCAAQSGCGTSYVARNMALIAAAQEKNEMQNEGQVLIVDMDIQNNAQSAHFSMPHVRAQYGGIDGPYDASFAQTPFWRVTPAMVDAQGRNVTDAHFMSLHRLLDMPLAYTYFHWEAFRQGQNAHIQNAREYWHTLRNHFSAIFVDTPALDRADILSAIVPEADVNILVSASIDAASQPLTDAAKKIDEYGGSCAGVILNDAPVSAQYGQRS